MRRRREKNLSELVQPKIYPDAVRDEERYFRYRRAVGIAEWFEERGKWVLSISDPDVKYEDHFINILIKEDDYGDEEVTNFATFIGLFDSIMFFYGEELRVSCMMEGLYKN